MLLLFFIISSLGPLVSKVKEHHVETIVDSLCSNMLSDNEQLRDISSIGKQLRISGLCECMLTQRSCLLCKLTALDQEKVQSYDKLNLSVMNKCRNSTWRLGSMTVSYNHPHQVALRCHKAVRLKRRCKRDWIHLSFTLSTEMSTVFKKEILTEWCISNNSPNEFSNCIKTYILYSIWNDLMSTRELYS